tara:strand:+ start:272 stop:1576 length:1305 start_codon:yes stop_codon:yes gene_type:complete
MRSLITILISVITFGSLYSQELKLEDAISTALSNNHGIVIAQMQEESSKTVIHIGAVGMLPTIEASSVASYNYSITDQEINGGLFPATQGQENAQTNQSTKLSASYLIYNGGSRLRSYSKLKSSGKLSELQTKISIESTLIQVVNTYYEVVRVNNQLKLIQSSLDLSRERLKRITINNEFGNATKLDVLNAQVDFNSDSSNVVNTELNLRKAKNELNYLLGRKISTEFKVVTIIELPNVAEADAYIQKAKENNTSLMLSNIKLNMAELDKKISQSNFMPTLSTVLDYGFTGSASDVGIIKSNSNVGYTAAISLKWNLFDGLKKQKALEQAKINIEVNNFKQQQTLLQIEKEAQNYYDALTQNIRLLNLENKNKNVANLNLERSELLLNNGTITSIQFRQAQLNLLKVENRINNINYVIKIYEYQLLRMTNELVK